MPGNQLAVGSTGETDRRNPDHVGAVAFAVTAGRPHATFHVDDEAFTRWCPSDRGHDDDDDMECTVPDWSEYGAGATLTQLFLGARENGVIGGDASVELNVHGDDDEETSGFFVVLNNRAGKQRPLGLTSGWHELLHLADIPPRQRAKAYLEEICTIANFMLARLQVQTATVAATQTNTVSITLSSGSCATWTVDGELADKLAALIRESYGPPAAGH